MLKVNISVARGHTGHVCDGRNPKYKLGFQCLSLVLYSFSHDGHTFSRYFLFHLLLLSSAF